MVKHLLALAVLLFSTPAPETGTVAGRVELWRGGAPRPDAGNAVVWIEGLHRTGVAPAAVRGQMESAKKTFTPRVVAVPREGSVKFPNSDPVFHNVFSVSGANRFDLGLYRSGAAKEKRFEQTGLVRVYCNIHPQMVGFVMVVNSDFSAVTGKDGSFLLTGVPAGSHVLKAWHEEGGEAEMALAVSARNQVAATVRLDVTGYKALPHKNKYGKDYPPRAGESDDERY